VSSDAEMISKAILNLKNNSDFVKDYIFPICMSFFSALLGALVGYLLYKRQVLVGYEELKFNAAMDVIFKYNSCLNSLVTVKSNYISVQTDDPIQRAMNFHRLVLTDEKVNEDVLSLSFILGKPYRKSIWTRKKKTISDEALSWANVTRVRTNLSNYNHALALLNVRSDRDSEIREILMKTLKQDDPKLKVSNEQILQIIGKTNMSVYIDLTEQCIALIDMLIQEMHFFLVSFPELANENLNTSLIKHRGSLPEYKAEKELYLKLLNPLPKPNVKKMMAITGMSQSDVEFRYTFGAW
jgi:hypothetical protein